MPVQHGSHAAKPVFVDPTGSRHRWVRALVVIAWVVLTLFVLSYIWALGTEPIVEQWSLADPGLLLPEGQEGP